MKISVSLRKDFNMQLPVRSAGPSLRARAHNVGAQKGGAPRPKSRVLGAVLLAGAVLAAPSAARAQSAVINEDVLPLADTHPMAFAVMGAFATCGLASMVGNAVTYAQNKPHRGWMTAGFVCGFLNFVAGPIVLVYGRKDVAAFGYGAGAAHIAIGATTLGLAIANAVRWHKQRVGELPPPPVALLPLYNRTPQSGQVYGLALAGGF